MKRRETVIIPMTKKKLGAGADPVKEKPPVTSLTSTQFAVEQVVRRVVALEKQCDGLAKLDKEKDIRINALTNRVQSLERDRKSLRERVEARDSE